LQKSEHNRHGISLVNVQEAIIDLAARGFLRVDGAVYFEMKKRPRDPLQLAKLIGDIATG
jgi:hypothetical protein